MLDELKFFPGVVDLVEAARWAEFQVRGQPTRDGLEDACRLEGYFEISEWQALADEFERCGRINAAVLREKAGRIAKIVEIIVSAA